MRTRHLPVFAAVVAVAGLLAGCTGSPSDGSPDPATLLDQSSETTKGQTSAHLQLAVDGQIAGLPVESLEGDLTLTPAVAAKGTGDMMMLGQRLENVEFVVADSQIWVAVTPGGGMTNLGPASAVYDVSAILDPDAGLANVLADFSDAKSDGSETVGGVDTVRITGKVSADAVNKICPPIQATEAVPGTVWIAEDGDHELIQARLEPNSESSLTMTMSKWGDPVTVETPAG